MTHFSWSNSFFRSQPWTYLSQLDLRGRLGHELFEEKKLQLVQGQASIRANEGQLKRSDAQVSLPAHFVELVLSIGEW